MVRLVTLETIGSHWSVACQGGDRRWRREGGGRSSSHFRPHKNVDPELTVNRVTHKLVEVDEKIIIAKFSEHIVEEEIIAEALVVESRKVGYILIKGEEDDRYCCRVDKC